jgi:hypothetical protein
VKKLEQLYCEQEGILRHTIEHVIIEDNRMDSSDGSCDMSEGESLSGVKNWKRTKDSFEKHNIN